MAGTLFVVQCIVHSRLGFSISSVLPRNSCLVPVQAPSSCSFVDSWCYAHKFGAFSCFNFEIECLICCLRPRAMDMDQAIWKPWHVLTSLHQVWVLLLLQFWNRILYLLHQTWRCSILEPTNPCTASFWTWLGNGKADLKLLCQQRACNDKTMCLIVSKPRFRKSQQGLLATGVLGERSSR